MPKDLIALVLILGLIAFKLTGHDGSLDTVVAVIVGYYFGHRKDKIDPGV